MPRVSVVISEAQFRRLLILGSGGAVVAPGKRDWAPLLRRGLVAPAWTVPDCRGLGPLRITSAGFLALAAAADQYDWTPEYGTRQPPREEQHDPYEDNRPRSRPGDRV